VSFAGFKVCDVKFRYGMDKAAANVEEVEG